jgi:hypothetical protein
MCESQLRTSLGTAEGAGFSQMMEQLRYERLMICRGRGCHD